MLESAIGGIVLTIAVFADITQVSAPYNLSPLLVKAGLPGIWVLVGVALFYLFAYWLVMELIKRVFRSLAR